MPLKIQRIGMRQAGTLESAAASKKLPLWFRLLKGFSYALLFGSSGMVFLGSVYVLFFVDESQVSPGSQHAGVPLSHKFADLAFLVVIFLAGYVVNRLAGARTERSL